MAKTAPSNSSPAPYDGTAIFKPVRPLAQVMAAAEAKRNDKNDPLAKSYADGNFYQKIYDEAVTRLSRSDLLSLEQAAQKLDITPVEYRKLADKGETLLIGIEGKNYVPAFIFTEDGRIDPLKIDIAREFVLQGHGYFKFLDYLKFMTETTADISSTLPPQRLTNIFDQAGLAEYRCNIAVNATMNQLADGRHSNPEFMDILTVRLDAEVTWGGWDPSGGLSRPFRDKYNIPGLTIDESRQEHMAENEPKPDGKPKNVSSSPKPRW